MKLRIESDDLQPHNTKVVNDETGEMLNGVQELTINCCVKESSTVTLVLKDVEIKCTVPLEDQQELIIKEAFEVKGE